MSLLFRCSSCQKEMVLESYHQGRNVPCPWCGAREDVPEQLDFATVYRERQKDESSGQTLLTVAIVSMIVTCLPVTAIVWWMASGRIHRAREEQREADPLLLNARVLAAIGTVISGLIWGGVAIANLT